MSYIIVKRGKTNVVGARRPLQASAGPHEHQDHEAALTEARRLASENPNFEFIIMQTTRVICAKVTLEETAHA